jgi:hypothetical protein
MVLIPQAVTYNTDVIVDMYSTVGCEKRYAKGMRQNHVNNN